MKKRAVIIFLVFAFVLCIVPSFASKSYADPFTAGQIASTAYAMMQSWGISFTAGSATASGMNDFMSSQIEDYVNSRGGTIADVFAGQIAVDVAGKLVVGQQMYNSVVGFVDWLSEKFNLGNEESSLSDGYAFGVDTITDIDEEVSGTGISVIRNQNNVFLYYNGKYVAVSTFSWNGPSYLGMEIIGLEGYSLEINENGKTILTTHWLCRYIPKSGGEWVEYVNTNSTTTNLTAIITDVLSWNGTDYVAPTVLNPDKEWTGTIGGYSTPDTNLDQLLGDIDQAVADNNLVVDGEVIDVPVPPGPVPTWTPVDDVIDGINQGGEILDGIGNDIGDIAGHVDDLGDQIGDVTDAIEGVQQGIQTQTGVISGALDQAASDVASAIESQTAALDESLTATAEGIQDISDILTAPEIDTPKFDLRELFPFCIPFDIYHLLQAFDGTPAAPHVQFPIVIPSIGFSYTLDLDFSAWNPVAAAMRTAELIVYALGLAWATSKVIKW